MTQAHTATDESDLLPLVVPLAELTNRELAVAGAKAVRLGEMIRAHLPVPAGFCLTTTAYRTWLKTSRHACLLFDRLSRTPAPSANVCLEIAGELRPLLAAHPITDAVETAIRAILRGTRRQGPWAVRSSATTEDWSGASFAGQHDSFLNVRGVEEVLQAVRRCWVSLFTDRAVVYRLKNHVPHRDAAMAVVVQEMVTPETSGVLFTADPLTGNTHQIMIEWVQGLGEQLVSGRTNPGRMELEKATLKIRKCTPPPASESGSAAGVRQAMDRHGLNLNEAVVKRLGRLAVEVERLLGGPQDIEWAATAHEVFLLQARPVTALPPHPVEIEPDIWTRANAVDALPEVVTPMAWSILENLVENFLQPILRGLGLKTVNRPLASLIAGRAYLNLRVLAELFKLSGSQHLEEFRIAFGGSAGGLSDLIPSLTTREKVSWCWRWLVRLPRLLIWLLPGLVNQPRLVERWCRCMSSELASVSPPTLSDAELADHPRALLQLACTTEGKRTWAAGVWMVAGGIGASTAVFRLTRRWLGDLDGSLANRLIAGARDMNSAENGRELARLAAWAREWPGLKSALLEPAAFAQLEPRLLDLAHGPDFLERWHHFMNRHGHQARGGMDVAQPRWAETPDFVLDMLRVCLRFRDDQDPLMIQARRRRERDELLADCCRRLGNPLRRRLLVFLINAGQRGLAQRENVKNEGVRMMALIRRALFEAGRRLVQRGVLRAPEEVFFLRLEELEPALGGQPGFDTGTIVAARQAEHARYQSLTPPSLVVGRYDPALHTADPLPADAKTLQGLAVSPGVVTGKARIILQADANERMSPGEILVAPYTDPGWTPYFLCAAAVVVDVGGLFSHGSVVAREYGLPAVVNVGQATRLIRTGQVIRVDGNRGSVTLLDAGSGPSP